MRLGVSTAFSNEDAKEWISKQVEVGCKTVVFPIDCNATDDKISQYKKAAEEHNVTIAEVGIWRNPLARDKKESIDAMEYSVKQLGLADRIGARCCVNIVGTPHGNRWDGGYRNNFDKETRKRIVESIRTIIDEVNPKNTKFTIEPMPWMVPTGPDDYLQLIEEVERDAFAVHLDFINMVNSMERYFYMDEFLEECFDKLGNRIQSCHLKDIKLLDEFTFQLRECACGQGVFNIVKYVQLADKYDMDMPMIIEHLHSDEEYLQSIRYVKNLLAM